MTDAPYTITVSLITVVKNAERHLEEALQSIQQQTYPHIEHIVVDGESTDGTAEILNRYQASIAQLIRGPDAGIYDAMNKGIAAASGDIIGFLNADDVLYPHAIEQVVEALNQNPTKKYSYGPVDFCDTAGNIRGTSTPLPSNLRYARRYLEIPFPHLSMFVGKELFETYGRFDCRFKIRADYDLMLRLMDKHVSSARLPESVGKYRQGGISSGWNSFVETADVLKNHNVSVLYRSYSVSRAFLRTVAGQYCPPPIRHFLRRTTISKNSYSGSR